MVPNFHTLLTLLEVFVGVKKSGGGGGGVGETSSKEASIPI